MKHQQLVIGTNLTAELGLGDSVTQQRHLLRKLNCRGDRFATYQQDECTGRMNSPLQDCNYLGAISVVGRVSDSVTRQRHLQRKLNCRGEFIRHVSQVECTGRMNSPLQDCNYLGAISVVGRVIDSVTLQRHLLRKLNCRGEFIRHVSQDECTGRMNSPLQDQNYGFHAEPKSCLLYTSPSPRDRTRSRMPSSA